MEEKFTRKNLEDQIWYYMQIIRQTADSEQIKKVVKEILIKF